MSSRRIPSYRHQKSRNLAVVRIDGQDRYLGPYDSPGSHQLYNQLIADWLKRQPLKVGRVANICICELIVVFIQHAETYYVKDGKPTREFGCIKEACRPVRELFDSTLVGDFGPLNLQAVRHAMVEKGWSRKYVNKQISRVRRMFRFGVSQELVQPETYQALTAVPDLKKGRTKAIDHPLVVPVPDDVVAETLPELS